MMMLFQFSVSHSVLNPLNYKNNKINGFISGFGDDLFEAFFADDEPPKKKKPAAVAVETVAAAAAPAKPATKKTTVKKTPVKKTTVKKTATVAPVTQKVQAAEQELDLQHTPALLELAQQNDKKDSEPTSETNKMEESENLMVEGLDDDNENEDKNFIQVSSSEEGLKADDDEILAEDEDASLADAIETESDPKESGADDVAAAESQVVETVTKAAKKPAKKNKNKEEESGLLEGIVSALIDPDDETVKAEVSLQELFIENVKQMQKFILLR